MPPVDAETDRWFSEHVLPHEASLRAYLRHSLSCTADVEDVMQETYSRVLRTRERLHIRSVKGLLFTVARNAVRDLLRHRTRAVHESLTENSDSAVLHADTDVAESVSRNQEIAILADALRALPREWREVLLLRRMHGLSQKEIAARLSLPETKVENLIARGMRRCREHVQAVIAGRRPPP